MSSPPAITVHDVHKRFRLPRERVHTLKEQVLHPFVRTTYDELRALQGVSFTVRPGEFFGVVGRNGSGKSTLLKCLAGIYKADHGRIFVNGRVSTFIELGVGFNVDLAARENVTLNGTMLGLTPREARRRFDEVVEFAELREFTDLKLKNYSSGMLVRLAFAVMIQVDAEILLIDEVLAVGDAAFQQKCYEEFEHIKRSGRTVLLVTHDMGAVDRFCDRALLLEHGHAVEAGDPQRVGMRYLQLNFSEEARAAEAYDEVVNRSTVPNVAPPAREVQRAGDATAEILDAWFEDEDGVRTTVLAGGRPASFVLRARFAEEIEDPVFAMSLADSQRRAVLVATSAHGMPESGVFRPHEEATVRFCFDNVLAADRYCATPSIARNGTGDAYVDWQKDLVEVTVATTRTVGGLVDLPVRIALERVAGAAAKSSG